LARGGVSGDVKRLWRTLKEVDIVNPLQGKGWRAIQEVLDGGRSLPGVNYIPLPTIGEGLGEWFEASSYGKKRLEMLRSCRGIPAFF
jgi:hypothetical protein